MDVIKEMVISYHLPERPSLLGEGRPVKHQFGHL
jgi:hypothetical protein